MVPLENVSVIPKGIKNGWGGEGRGQEDEEEEKQERTGQRTRRRV